MSELALSAGGPIGRRAGICAALRAAPKICAHAGLLSRKSRRHAGLAEARLEHRTAIGREERPATRRATSRGGFPRTHELPEAATSSNTSSSWRRSWAGTSYLASRYTSVTVVETTT